MVPICKTLTNTIVARAVRKFSQVAVRVIQTLDLKTLGTAIILIFSRFLRGLSSQTRGRVTCLPKLRKEHCDPQPKPLPLRQKLRHDNVARWLSHIASRLSSHDRNAFFVSIFTGGWSTEWICDGDFCGLDFWN